MDRYNYLNKIFNMPIKQIPKWYAMLKNNRVSNRIMSNAITNPNSQLVKALLFTKFKLPMNKEYNNIVDIFKVLVKHEHTNKELMPYSTNSTRNSLVNGINVPTLNTNTQTDDQIVSSLTVDIAEWWGERTEHWTLKENRTQRADEAPEIRIHNVIEHLISGIEMDNINSLTEHIQHESNDPEDLSYWETTDTETWDEEYDDVSDTDIGFDENQTLRDIISFLRTIQSGQDQDRRQAVERFIRQQSNNEQTLESLITFLDENIIY
jgi:hypothetical protein